MMESFEEFEKRIRKASGPHIHKIRNSLGVYDAYKYYRKNKPKDKKFCLTESEYFSIIRKTNELMVREILKGNDIDLPRGMGSIEVRKYEKRMVIGKDGQIITNLPIDWGKTLMLWYEDKKAFEDKTLVRMDEKELYKIVWNKEKVNFNNRSFYQIAFNRDFKKELKTVIKKGFYDAFHIGRKEKRHGD